MRLVIYAAVVALAGCQMAGPAFTPPSPAWQPGQFDARKTAAVPETVETAWWALFQDKMLSDLEERIADGNFDVRVAGIRVIEARAQLGTAETAGDPIVDVKADAKGNGQSARGTLALNHFGTPGNKVPSSLRSPFSLFQMGFDASWEPDFWGRVKRSIEAADAGLTETVEMRHGVLIAAQAELAQDYIKLRGAQAGIGVVRDNLDTARKTLALTQQRFANGLTTELDVAGAGAQLATTAALLPALEQQVGQLINAMALLLGEPPGALRDTLMVAQATPVAPPRLPVGLPSELTRRRPDIRAAGARLHAATAEIGVATADFYPRFTLSANAALQALQPHYLADWGARSFGAGPAVTLPVFNGDKLTHMLELREAQQREAALMYQQAVLRALHDVDNALIASEADATRRTALMLAVEQNKRARALARERYEGGVIDFLSVLDAERRLLGTQQQLNDSTTMAALNIVQLYKALGGGWE
jgi:NodT family efflux transporter outer membrane factor (OMF) lipoprotein